MSFARKVWRLLVGIKDGLSLAFLLLFFWALFAVLNSRPSPAAVRDGALLLELSGTVVEEVRHGKPRGDSTWTLIAIAIGWAVLIGGWLTVALANPLVTDNRPRRDIASAEIDAQI